MTEGNGRTQRLSTSTRRAHRPASLARRLGLALAVMLLPVLAVAGTGVVTFRSSVGALEQIGNESLDEAKPIETLRDLLEEVDNVGEDWVEGKDPALGERFVALSRRIDQSFVDLSSLSTEREREVASGARLLWEVAFDDAKKAASGQVGLFVDELDRYHDNIDEAASLLADVYSLNVQQAAGEISTLRDGEQVQLLAALLTLIVSSIAAFVIARRLRRSITTPLLLLEEAATEFGSDNLSHRITVKSNDELGRVSDAFNAMAGKLDRNIGELREAREKVERLNAELEGRVLARTRDLEEANRDLLEAKEKAEEASRAKSEFFSRTSHELRTPLNAILGFGQLLETSTLSPDDRQSVHQILKGGRHLLNLINEVLDISQFDTQGASMSIESVSVDEIVNESMDLIRPLAETRKIEIEIDPLDLSWFVRADRQRLRQVLLNVLSNAVKFNRDGGTVWVSGVEMSTGTLAIRVGDSGPGIAAEQLERLFSPFDRLGAERTDTEGTGLGLALSKALVEAMGGQITVQSDEGNGSTFSVELERAEDPGRSFDMDDGAGSIASRNVVGTLLCVEDNASNLALIQRVFSHRPGVTVLTAREGLMGVELARQHQPSLVLMDLHLPDISGEEVLRILREDEGTKDIPVVVTSADATPARITRLQAAGAYDYLTKPLKVKELLELVDDMLAHPGHVNSGPRRPGKP